jgi:hypothetical protein
MDAGWAFGILFGIAAAVPATMIGIHADVGWWWVMVSPLPLVVWNVAWLIMAKPKRGLALAISGAVGMTTAAVVVFAIVGMSSSAANAQSTGGGSPTIQQNNQGVPNFNVPGSHNQFNLYQTPAEKPDAVRPAIEPDAIYQAGVIVGRAFGARRSPTDATIYTFIEISHADQMNLWAPFSYDGVNMVMRTTESCDGVASDRPSAGKICYNIVAKVLDANGR